MSIEEWEVEGVILSLDSQITVVKVLLNAPVDDDRWLAVEALPKLGWKLNSPYIELSAPRKEQIEKYLVGKKKKR